LGENELAAGGMDIGFSESQTPSCAVVPTPPDQKDFSGCRLLAFFFNGGGGVCVHSATLEV
jgi:hypothetical protein